MSVIEAINDTDNTFLSRREITCNFAGMGGKLGKLDAIDMVTKEFKLDGKMVIPMRLKNHVGKSTVTGTFFVYEDEVLAKSHVNPTIFNRLEKAKKSAEEKANAAKEDSEKTDAKPADAPKDDSAKPDAKEDSEKTDAPKESSEKTETPAKDDSADAPKDDSAKTNDTKIESDAKTENPAETPAKDDSADAKEKA